MSAPIESLLDLVEWEVIERPADYIYMPDIARATHKGVLTIGDFKFRCYQLSTGQRILNSEDVERFFSSGWATTQRDEALATVERNAGPTFTKRAAEFVVQYLTTHESASGEELTDAAKDAGIIPHSDKAFGAVYMSLSKQGVIEKCGFAQRLKGHRCSGANLWRLTQ